VVKKNTDRNKIMEIEKRRNSISEKNLKNNKKAGRPPHKPTEQSRNMVKEAVGMGMEQTMISRLLNIAPKTLRRFYREELDTGLAIANMVVAKALYGQAKSGKNTIASIFWLKAQAKWQDTEKVVHEGVPENITVRFALEPPKEKKPIDVTPVVDLIEQK
tara:strand:- start:52 stop:531 length:480 start_codon:yes stop_codon:yes gene_type:complete